MKVITRGDGRYGVSFEYKVRGSGEWIREVLYFRKEATREKAIVRIKRNPYNWRIKTLS